MTSFKDKSCHMENVYFQSFVLLSFLAYAGLGRGMRSESTCFGERFLFFFLRNLRSKKSFSVDNLCLLVPRFYCVFSFLTPRFVSTTANNPLWLPYLLFLLCVCFCFTLDSGGPIFVLRYANLFLSKFGTALNNAVIVSWWQCANFYIIVL